MKSKITWENSENLCEQSGSKLVSMERLRAELSFLTNHSETLKMKTTEYYIGLKKYDQKWLWISDNSSLEETQTGSFLGIVVSHQVMEIALKCGAKKVRARGLMYMTTLNARACRREKLDISVRSRRHLWNVVVMVSDFCHVFYNLS